MKHDEQNKNNDEQILRAVTDLNASLNAAFADWTYKLLMGAGPDKMDPDLATSILLVIGADVGNFLDHMQRNLDRLRANAGAETPIQPNLN